MSHGVILHHPVLICRRLRAHSGEGMAMNPSAAKWDDLKVFLEVARHGSVHAAAKRLKLDHSTVCRKIGRLEALLAVKLFDRSRKGISVRHEAQGLLKHVEQMDRHAGSLDDA